MRRLRSSWLAAALLLPACASEADDEPYLESRSAVGAVEGSDVVLGALVDGDSISVYACGGDQTFATHSGWFRGRIGDGDEAGAFDLQRDDLRLVGHVVGDAVEGELVEADGTRRPFTAAAVPDDDDAGLYLGTEGDANLGVVVLPDGGSLRAQGTSCDGALRCTQVIILAPLTIEQSQIEVQLALDDGSTVDTEVSRTLVAPAM